DDDPDIGEAAVRDLRNEYPDQCRGEPGDTGRCTVHLMNGHGQTGTEADGDRCQVSRDLRRAANRAPRHSRGAVTVRDGYRILGQHQLQGGQVTALRGVEEPLDQLPMSTHIAGAGALPGAGEPVARPMM